MRKKKFDINSFSVFKMGMLSFLIVFIVGIILNAKFNVLNKYPSDITSVYYAARLHGYNWSNAIQGATFSPLTTWIYYLVACIFPFNGFGFARVALAIMVVFRAFTAFLATAIAKKYGKCSNIPSLFIGIIAALAITGRANYLSNTAILAFLFIVAVYMVERFNHNDGNRYVSVIVALVCIGLMSAVSFQLILLLPIAALYFVIDKGLDKKTRVMVCATAIISMILIELLVVITSRLTYGAVAVEGTNVYQVQGTVENSWNELIRSFRLLGSFAGIKALVESIVVSFWSAGVFSWGIAILALIIAFKDRNNKSNRTLRFTFAILAISVIIKGLSILGRMMRIHLTSSGLFGSIFDVSNYSYVIVPIIVYGLIFLLNREISKKEVIISSVLFSVASVVMLLSLFLPVMIHSDFKLSSVFYQNDSLLLSSFIGGSSLESAIMIIIACFVLVLMFALICRSLDKRLSIGLLTTIFIFQYISGWLFIDNASRVDRELIIKASYDSLSDSPINDDSVWTQIDEVYYKGSFTGPYLYQFAFMNANIVPDLPDESAEEYVIFSGFDCETMEGFIDFDETYYYCVDPENHDEFLYVKGDRYLELFEDLGIEFQDAAQLAEARLQVKRIYQYIFNRGADVDGLIGWSNVLLSDEYTYRDIIEIFINTDEYADRGYGNSHLVYALYEFYLDWSEEDEDIFVPSKESVEALAEVSNSLTTDEVLDFYM